MICINHSAVAFCDGVFLFICELFTKVHPLKCAISGSLAFGLNFLDKHMKKIYNIYKENILERKFLL